MITVDSIHKRFGSVHAVNGVTFTASNGRVTGLLGPNGAGKSTTIKCLTGLLRPTSGTFQILGIDPMADPVAVKRKIGVMPEDLALFDRLTGAETLSFVGQVHGLGAASILSPTIGKFGDAAGSGLGLWFLKFSRDDERQAHRHFRGCHGDDEENHDLPVEVVVEAREGDQREVG